MSLMSVAEALGRIVGGVQPLPAETVPIFEAAGRILAADLKATLTQPPFAASAMDGYAVRAADVPSVPACLDVIGMSAAGHGFAGEVGRGKAVRIFTGAPLPEGADAVVIQENARSLSEGAVEIFEAPEAGQHVRPKGYDFSNGETLLAAGIELQSRQLMLAAAMNHAVLPVRQKPVIAVLTNGDELVEPGERPGPGQVVSSIPAAMKAAIASWGGAPLLLDLARDTKDSIAARIVVAREADVLLTIGGASVGEHDLVRPALEEMGARFDVLKTALRPGKPTKFGFLGRQRILSVPGNPVAALVSARLFLRPLIDALLGRKARDDDVRTALLAVPVEANGERAHYIRATISADGVVPLADQDSSLMSAFATADCLLVRPAHGPALAAGASVPIIPLDF